MIVIGFKSRVRHKEANWSWSPYSLQSWSPSMVGVLKVFFVFQQVTFKMRTLQVYYYD